MKVLKIKLIILRFLILIIEMNKFVCQYCLESFKTSNSLLKHQQTQKNCISYRDVIFVCKICNFSTYGIKNIENHISKKSCSMDNVTII